MMNWLSIINLIRNRLCLIRLLLSACAGVIYVN